MKSILMSVIFLLFACFVKAQHAAPVTPGVSEKNIPLIFEKTYLHTDRDVYARGDTLWFKAYLVNAQDNKPINSSHTLYVELLAPDSAKISNREIIRLDNGLGNGDMELADTLASGKYRLRAYTNWMRNFGDNLVFEKNITILNTQAVPAAPDPKIAAKSKKAAKSKTGAATSTSTTITSSPAAAIANQPIIRFYPEGGSLVNGISSLIAVKADDGYGLGIPVSGSVLSSTGDTISRFSCDSLGMGLFAMLPIAGQTYYAIAGKTSFNFPTALSKGPGLHIRQTDSLIHAIISISDTSVKVTNFITVKHGGITLLSQQLQMKAKPLVVRIPTATLPEGISAITLYDEENKPECERLVYIHHPDDKGKVSITTNKRTYKPKEPVTVNISTKPNANLSMAVIDAGITPEQADDIVSYLQLQSEVKGSIENARRYFDTTNVNRFKQLDLLLMNQGWRDFVWRRLADTAIRISYAAESGISVPGRIWDEVRNKYLPDLNVSLHADGAKGNKLFSTTTDSAGRFHFDGLMLYGKQNVRLASVDDKGKSKGSFMIDTILPMAVKPHNSRPVGLYPVDSTAAVAVEKRLETMKTSKLFGVTRLNEVTIKDKKTIVTRNTNILTTLGYPDQIFNITPKDYQYKTLEWFILQNIKGAVKSTKPYAGIIPTGVEFFGMDTIMGSEIGVRGRLMPPIIFVNGNELYMDEPTQAEHYRITYFNMPMNKFKKVELRHMVGTLHGINPMIDPGTPINGIVDRYLLYLTMQNNYTNDNPGFLSIDVSGYYESRKFYEPSPNAKPSVNDYRTTIHWEPYIKTDTIGKATVSFYNAVPQTSVRLIVQGITPDGIPLTATAIYKVEQNQTD